MDIPLSITLLAVACILSSCHASEQEYVRSWFSAAFLGEPLVAGPAEPATDLPFSFTYDGKSSAELLPKWKRTDKAGTSGDPETHELVFTDPATGLEVTCRTRLFAGFPAVEWVMYFRNTGETDTPILGNIRPLDLSITAPPKGDVVLHHAHGSNCTELDFLPIDEPLAHGSTIDLAPVGGRSSDSTLPFFSLEWSGGGVVTAVGWSGQWSASASRDGGRGLRLAAGQQTTHLKLHPGETIRTPRILLVFWQGDDRFHGHNLLRQLLLKSHVPRVNGEIFTPPVTENTWFVFNAGNDTTEANQLEAISTAATLGVEAFWLDAGWFEGGWPAGAGSWVPKKEAFPRGLKPLGDAAHAKGMKFVVWFEPERVNMSSRIGREHPEWVLRSGDGDGLFNLGDPAAREWLTDYLSKCIEDWGIDIYRNDFNIDPLRFWQAADAPDRQGMAEIRYIEGLYVMWDELLRRRPGLAIDNCASGGRRIDLETCSRSVPLWRSDTQCCGKPMPVWDQVQSAGLNLYVPLASGGVWDFDPYIYRSIAMTGMNLCMDTRLKDFQADKARRAIQEAKSLRPLYLGDYYPLTDINLDERHWIAWQFDRPDLGEGFAMYFRRSNSPYTSIDSGLHAINPKAKYEVTIPDSSEKRRMTGSELARMHIEIDSAPASLLLRYKRVGK